MLIGEIIKQRREELNLTQKKLASEICTQAMISRIEQNLVEPSNKLLKEIAQKLDAPISYFRDGKNPVNSKLKKLEYIMRDHLNKMEYDSISYLIMANKELISNQQNDYFEVFFNWIESVLAYYKDNDSNTAIQQLVNLYNSYNISKELTIDILGTIGAIYYETGEHENAAKYYNLAFKKIDKYTPYKKKVKIFYNYSLNLESLDKYKEALDLVLESIDVLVSNHSLYMLGYLYFHKAYLLRNFKQYSEAIEAYENSYIIFKILGYEKMMLMTKIELEEVKQTHEKKIG